MATVTDRDTDMGTGTMDTIIDRNIIRLLFCKVKLVVLISELLVVDYGVFSCNVGELDCI